MLGPKPLGYLTANVFVKINQHEIGTLLSEVPFKSVINGSLWTLYNEVRCYLALALLGVAGATRHRRWILLTCLATLLGFYYLELSKIIVAPVLNGALLVHACYFISGAVYYIFGDRIAIDWRIFAAAACLILASFFAGFYTWIALIVWPYILICLALRLPITNWGARGDFSYGLYIYAFPIQQLLAALHFPRFGVWPYIVVAFFATLTLAILSYRFIEHPALTLKSWRPTLKPKSA